MKNQKEAQLPESFAKKLQEKSLSFIKAGQSFSLIGMPSVGISPFLRFIESRIEAYPILLDVYELPTFTKAAFLNSLFCKITTHEKDDASFTDCKDALQLLVQEKGQVVIIINKIDLLAKEFSEAFLGNFRTLCYENEGKVSLLFSVNKPYIEINPSAVIGSNMHIFSRYVYFLPYDKSDLIELLKLHSPEALESPQLEKAIMLCGGHIQLLQLILRSATPNNLLEDPYITLLLKQIMTTLTKKQQTMLTKVAEGKAVDIDTYLMNIGVVRLVGNELIMFSPLLKDYLLSKKAIHLSVKEQLLFQLLKNSHGKIISKEKIFEIVWKNDPEGATDWALDSLIYRLRKHPLLKEKGLDLINHKKLGYQLVRE